MPSSPATPGIHEIPPASRAAALRRSLPADHVVAVMIDEHTRILEVLRRLEQCVANDRPTPGTSGEVTLLAEELLAAEPHHQREEQVLFPALRARGVDGPPQVMEAEHVELRALKHAVHDGSRRENVDAELWSRLRGEATELIGLLRTHIHKENEILYPLAVQVVSDPAEWEAMRKRCDAIGYCCHHGDGNDSG